MNTVAIYIKTEQETKEKAQRVAKELGLSLSAILNGFLKQFIKTKTVVFSTEDEVPNKYLINALKQSEEDVKAGRVITFKTSKKALDYLDQEIAHEKRRKHSSS